MADFAKCGEAVIRGLGWEPGTLLHSYNENRRAANETSLDESEVAQALLRMMDSADAPWRGTAAELLHVLGSHKHAGATKAARWPKTPRLMSCALREISPQLRAIGTTVAFERDRNVRIITITPSQRRDPEVNCQPSIDR